MTSPLGSSTGKSIVRALAGAALAAAAFCVTGCASPLANDSNGGIGGREADSILVRAIMDGTLSTAALNAPTQNLGVHELSSVNPGPSGAIVPAEARFSPITPTTNPAATQASATTEPGGLGVEEPIFRISLEESIARALAHSLAIKVEAYNPAIKEYQITEALAVFDPVLFAQSQLNNQDQPPVLASVVNGVVWSNSVGVRQNLPSGGTVQAGVGEIYRDFQNKNLVTPNSSHEGNINVGLTQPLLRGFGSDVTMANIYLAQRDYRISLTQFRRKVIQTIADTEEAYHNLVLAQTAADIQQRLLDMTQDTSKKIDARINIDANRVNISQAHAAVQERLAELIRAKAQVRNASDRLKSLLNDPELDLKANTLLLPSDRPLDVPMAYNIGEQVDVALRQRTEMQEARLQIQRADIIVNVSRNDLLPKADLTLSAQSNGFDNSFETAFTQTYDAPKLIDYAAGLKIEVPIGNEQAEAAYRRRLMERKQAVTNMLLVASQVILDVKTQLREILTSFSELQAREAARVLAGDELRAIEVQEDVQRLSPEFLQLKLDSQQRLANAELLELQALVGYNIAIMKLEQAKGTLLEYNRIAIDRPPETDEAKGKIRFMGQSYDWKPSKP